MKTDFDILIVGGGLVGLSLACALRESRFNVGIVEAVVPAVADQPGYDDRTLALAYGSRRIFEGIGVWDAIAQRSAMPIKRIHISDRGRFGFTRLRAADLALDALGYVVSAPVLGRVLYRAIDGYSNIHLISPATVQAVDVGGDVARVRISANGVEHDLQARLVVAADGANSPVREAAGIAARRIEYHQSAVVTAVTPEHAHENTAYERFTASGPVALLPAGPDHCAVVWTMPKDAAEVALGLDDDAFRARLQECFGERLGRFSRVGRRQAYPLVLTRVREHVRARLAVMGNAAHTVHPVAGQGFNLGLRDVAAMAEILVENGGRSGDVGDIALLRRYARWRARDTGVISTFTHSLTRIFSNDRRLVACARDVGLVTVDLVPPIKRGFIRVTSGLAGRLPRLARGLPLRGALP